MTEPTKPPPDSPEVLARLTEGLEVVELLARQMRRHFGKFVQYDDLTSQGREALLAAARSFEADRGLTFRKWANLRVRGAMIDSIRANGNVPRRVYLKVRALQAADHVHEVAAEDAPPTTPEEADQRISDQLGTAAVAMAISFLTMGAGDALDAAQDPKAGPEEDFGRAELLEAIRAAIAERPEAERHLLQRHYFDDVNFDEAARELGLSKSWASRLHARAIEGLAKALKSRGIGS